MICQIANDSHQELFEVRNIWQAHRSSSTMYDFVEHIEKTNYNVLGSTECRVSTNHFNE